MGCNCGKNRKTAAEAKAAQAQSPSLNQNQQSTQGTTQSVPAPANGGTQSFALQMRDGKMFRFGSRLEAEAENVRRGYTGTVKPA